MNNKIFLVFGIIFIFGIALLLNISTNHVTENNNFNVCEEQPLFGMKYENCNDINCVNFYENIKKEIKGNCK